MTNARDLTARLADLLSREHHAMADFLVALADFDRRRLWLDLGHSSLFYFLHRELGLSKGAAHFRKTAAELLQRFPDVERPLRDGRLCITSIVELSKVITPENRDEILPRFFHCSKQEAKAISAELQPATAAPHRDVVTAARPPLVQPRTEMVLARPMDPTQQVHPVRIDPEQSVHPDEPHASGLCAPAPRTPTPAQRDSVEPLTADLSRLHVTVSRSFLQKLEAARAALSHSRPGASSGDLLEEGLDLVLAEDAKRKGLVKKPRKEPPPAKSDRIPAHVRRAVWARDGGCCQWRVDSGGVCGSKLRLQFDHVTPRARGGPSTVENVRLLCAVHNDLAARRVFGDAWMDRFTRKREQEPVEEPVGHESG